MIPAVPPFEIVFVLVLLTLPLTVRSTYITGLIHILSEMADGNLSVTTDVNFQGDFKISIFVISIRLR